MGRGIKKIKKENNQTEHIALIKIFSWIKRAYKFSKKIKCF